MPVKTTILLVDCNEDTLLSIKDGLESYDRSYEVDWVKDASECLNYVRQKKPDLFLINIMLPEMDGFTLMEKLKMTDAKNAAFIYMTAKYDYDMIKKVNMLTADDFIAHPINIPELILRIQKIIIWRCYRKRPKAKD
ncbi:MAG: response regulator [Candidatus Altiarchaeota archaeon]|nr:response regulator [Candidatus Altiarchaeota archaeon]